MKPYPDVSLDMTMLGTLGMCPPSWPGLLRVSSGTGLPWVLTDELLAWAQSSAQSSESPWE